MLHVHDIGKLPRGIISYLAYHPLRSGKPVEIKGLVAVIPRGIYKDGVSECEYAIALGRPNEHGALPVLTQRGDPPLVARLSRIKPEVTGRNMGLLWEKGQTEVPLESRDDKLVTVEMKGYVGPEIDRGNGAAKDLSEYFGTEVGLVSTALSTRRFVLSSMGACINSLNFQEITPLSWTTQALLEQLNLHFKN